MKRQRITITLKKDVINLLDEQIDKEKLRNRSQAIEYFLSQTLFQRATKVLILAGGRGVNFRPLTYEIPKALIPIRGKPLLEYTLEKLKKYQFSEIYISIGHLGKKIKEYFSSGEKWGLEISYLEQSGKSPGTAQPVFEAQKIFNKEPFILIYGDVLAEIDLQDLLKFHYSQKGVATMALASVEKPSDWGMVKLKGNLITEFLEKPKEKKIKSHLVNAGIFVLKPEIFNYLKKNTVSLEKEVFPKLVSEKKIYGYPFEDNWHDISTPEIYEEVLKNWQ